jgi:hypothetical protein
MAGALGTIHESKETYVTSKNACIVYIYIYIYVYTYIHIYIREPNEIYVKSKETYIKSKETYCIQSNETFWFWENVVARALRYDAYVQKDLYQIKRDLLQIKRNLLIQTECDGPCT